MKSVLLFMTESDSTVCVDHILFIHSSVSVNGCLGFHIFAIVNSAAMNICVPVWTRYFSSFTYTPRSAGLYSNSMFNLLRNCQTVSHGGCTILFIFSNVWLFWGSTYCIACCIESWWPWNLKVSGNSLAVQWLNLCTSTAGGLGSIPGQGTKILKAV